MTARLKYLINGITDRGAGQPKTVTGSWVADSSIPVESRLLTASGWNAISLNIDNAAFLAQLGVGKVLIGDFSVEDSAPAIAPAPAPVPAQLIAVNDWPTTILEAGPGWVFSNEWGIGNLTRGTYTDVNGTNYEQKIGVSQQLGTNGEVSWRVEGKWPTGTTEVKAYPNIEWGNQPGWANTWITPGGYNVQLPDGSISQKYPSGPTPNTFFPLALPLTSLKSTVNYVHNATPTGHGQITYDIWLQSTATQEAGFDLPANKEITTEIMIPLDYWGGYGAYVAGGGGRNPSWYVKDDTIDGRLWHIYHAVPYDANNTTATNMFASPWDFVVFEPDQPGLLPGTLDLAAFVNYTVNQGWANGVAGITTKATHCVNTAVGIEPKDGTFDVSFSNCRVFQ